MTVRLPIERTAGTAVMRKMIRVKARVQSKPSTVQPDGHILSGMLWMDIDGAEAEPFRFRAVAHLNELGNHVVDEFAPLQGALSGGAKGLASFYERALQELVNENPQLIG